MSEQTMSIDKKIEEVRKDIFAAFGGYAKWEEDWQSLAEAVYNAGYRKQEWISIDEMLPEEKVNCLVHYKHAYCDNDGYWAIGVTFYDGNKFVIGKEYKITHWMPLPEAPKMKGGAE
jgi:hypothetical protein